MASNLDALTSEVGNETTVVQSAITLINGLAAQIQAAGTDPTKLNALVSQLKANDDALAAAVAQNTPAASSAPASAQSQPGSTASSTT